MALWLLRAQQDQSLKILPPSFGCLCSQVVRRLWLVEEEGWGERTALCSVLPASFIRAVYPSPKVIAWPLLMHLKSDHLCCFRSEWGTFLQSSRKEWSLESGVAGPGPREPGARSVTGGGFRRRALVPLILCREWLVDDKSFTPLERTELVLPRPKRVTCDCINFRGTVCRQQLLLIFNTKSQGNSEGKDALLPRIEIGEWWDSQLVPASSPMHFFAS